MSTFRPIRHPQAQGGGGLIVAMLVLAIVLPLVGIAMNYTSAHARMARRERDYLEANAACESAIEYAYAKWKDWVKTNGGRVPLVGNCDNTLSPNVGATTVGAQTLLNGSKKFAGATLMSLNIEPVDATDVPVDGALAADAQKAKMRVLIPLQSMPRRYGRTYIYRCTARTTVNSGGTTLSTKLVRYFRKADASLWQAMMWFEGDLELFPTPAMPLYGWIHTNSNAYLAHANNSNELTINSDFTYTGNSSTLHKGDASTIQNDAGLVYGVTYLQQLIEPGWANWKPPVWNNGGYSAQVSNVTRIDPLSKPRDEVVNTADADHNNDSLREIIERPVDTDGNGKRVKDDDSTDFKERRYYTSADLKIIVNRSTAVAVGDRIKILDKDDNRLTGTFVNNVVNQALGKDATTGLPSTKTLYDYRQAGNVTSASAPAAYTANGDITATNIDVSKLTPLLDGYTGYQGGVIYFKDETPTDTAGVSNQRAARLQKGGTLPTIGMTFVTEDGVYIHGDYNTGTTYDATTGAITAQPNSNATTGADPLQNVVGTYAIKPAAICGDAVTFLSNAWQDVYDATTPTNSRVSLPTTYNSAFMSGYVPTDTTSSSTAGVRSGGGINFPRVLENWNGQALTYHGSMVQLYDSQVFNSPWVPSIYGAPKRPWNFENRFIDNPPPGPLEFTEYSRGRFIRTN